MGDFSRKSLNIEVKEFSIYFLSLSQVKVLPNKPGTAMAHMDNPVGAKNAIHHLHGHKLLGTLLELK